MDWIVFDQAVVVSRIPTLESDALNEFDGEKIKVPLEQIIAATISEVRTAIASCSRNRLHPETTRIPMSLVNDAVSLVSYYFATRAPGVSQTVAEDPRYQAWRAAKDKLEAVASGKVPVENPFTGAVSGGQSAAVQIEVTDADRMRMCRSAFFGL